MGLELQKPAKNIQWMSGAQNSCSLVCLPLCYSMFYVLWFHTPSAGSTLRQCMLWVCWWWWGPSAAAASRSCVTLLHWHNVTTLQVLSRDLLRGRAAVIQARRGAGRVMELQTIITNYNVQRTAAASLAAAPWPRHKWICTDSDSELLKWFSLSDSCSLRAERPAAGGDNWEYSQIKTIRGRILPRCKLGRTLLAFHNPHATM